MNVASLTALAAHWPTDWILIGACAVFVALVAWRGGIGRPASLVLALPLAFFVFQSLSSAAIVGSALVQLQTPLAQSGIFLILVIAAYMFVHRIIGFYADAQGLPMQSLIAGAATAVLILVFWLQVAPLSSIWHFGLQVQTIFGEGYRLWWLVLAYLALALVRT